MSDPFSDSSTSASPMRIDSADYELLWPPALLIRELTTLRCIDNASERVPKIERLLEEAFLGDAPLEDYRGSASRTGVSISASRRYNYIADLLASVPRLREHRRPAPYWSMRHNLDLGGHSSFQRTLPQVRDVLPS